MPVPRDAGLTTEPGLFPLRPMAVGEILGAAIRVVRRHLLVLAPIALVIGAAATTVEMLILNAFGELNAVATGSWAVVPAQPDDAWLSGVLTTFRHLLLAEGGSLSVSLLTVPILTACAAAGVAVSAISKSAGGTSSLGRLRGRWASVVGSGVLAGLFTVAGLLVLVVPGIVIWVVLLPVAPVAALEGGRPTRVIRRATRLSAGFRGRLFGISLLAVLISVAAQTLVGSVLGALVPAADPVQNLLVAQAVGTVVGAFTASWSATVTALLYVDIRIRREGLADALRGRPPSPEARRPARRPVAAGTLIR